MHARILIVATAVCTLASTAFASTRAAEDDDMPADFHGEIVYRGTHEGFVQQTAGRRSTRNNGGTLGGLIGAIAGGPKQTYAGTIEIRLIVAGSKITASISGTGGIRRETITGIRTGNRCRFTTPTMTSDLLCTRSRYAGRGVGQPGQGYYQQLNVDATAVSLAHRAPTPPAGSASTMPRQQQAPHTAAARPRALSASRPWSERSHAEPTEVTDLWIGRVASEVINGQKFFESLATSNYVLTYDSSKGRAASSLIFGSVIRSSRTFKPSADRPQRAVYVIPYCWKEECTDPDKGATRLVTFMEYSPYTSGKSQTFEYLATSIEPHKTGVVLCSYRTHLDRLSELSNSGCVFIERKPTVITKNNALRYSEIIEAEHAKASDEERKRNPPSAQCAPRVRYTEGHEIGGEIIWGCDG